MEQQNQENSIQETDNQEILAQKIKLSEKYKSLIQIIKFTFFSISAGLIQILVFNY